MADPTVPWGIPTFDDNTPFAPIQAPFNSQSAALNDALSDGAFQPYATKVLMDAVPGTRVGQHASVYADGTVANNGDYRWSGTVWIQTWTADGTWVAVALGSGWTNEASNAVMVRRKNGIVFTRGRASTTGSNASAFTYPAGMLPDWTGGTAFPADANGTATVRVYLLDSGVAQVAGSYANVGFASIPPFPAA